MTPRMVAWVERMAQHHYELDTARSVYAAAGRRLFRDFPNHAALCMAAGGYWLRLTPRKRT